MSDSGMIIIIMSKCIFVRLPEPMRKYVEKRAEDAKSNVSEFIRFLITLDMDRGKNNITLEAVNNQLAKMQESINELLAIKDQLEDTNGSKKRG